MKEAIRAPCFYRRRVKGTKRDIYRVVLPAATPQTYPSPIDTAKVLHVSMGNAVGFLWPSSTVIPSEGGGVKEGGIGGVANKGGGPAEGVACADVGSSRQALECAHEPPTSIMEVLLNALYAMEFHKHLAMTNRSENYEFFQAVSHFTQDTSTCTRATCDEAKKIYNLYVSDAAPLRVSLGENISAQIKQTFDTGEVPKQTFDAAKEEVVKLMEKESLQDFLTSDLYSNLQRRIHAGELEALIQEDIDTVRDIMSKELIEFLGDPDLKTVLSSQMGIDWFRKYLVTEFAEEGLDLWKVVHDMLMPESSSSSERRSGSGKEHGVVGSAAAEEAYATPEATAALTAALATPEGEEAGSGDGGGGDGGSREGGGNGEGWGDQYDIRKSGQEIYTRFIKSGCGAECNLPGTVVRKVVAALDDPESSPEAIRKAFEQVEVEIFKLLAYDPFLRFKRSGLYTKYCMKTRLKT